MKTIVGCIVTVVGYYIVIGNVSCKREKCFMKRRNLLKIEFKEKVKKVTLSCLVDFI